MTRRLTEQEVIDLVRGLVWSYDHYCPFAACRFIEEHGPFVGLSVEESVHYQTGQLRQSLVAEGVDAPTAVEAMRAHLKEEGYEPAPYPWQIDLYVKAGLWPKEG